MNIQRVPIASLTPDPENARRHPERNLKIIKDSLNKFGQQHPLIVDQSGTIIAGNGRWQAMRDLGWTECDIVRTTLAGNDARAFSIADNRASDTAAWDDPTLIAQLEQIAAGGSDLLNAAGYEYEELRSLLERSPEAAAELGKVEGGVAELNNGFSRSLEAWQDSQVRSLVFGFSASQYALVVEALASIAEDNGLESNTDVLVYLLEKAGHAVSERIEADS